jgi:NADPH-dependent 2,4-dienoyl-CoA reductase/sulfur reductase-like enzyme
MEYGTRKAVAVPRRVFVIGGGPAGMKAAAVAAERGHDVTLYESSARLGGQALLAASLPGRADFGGIVPNLTREMEQAGVRVVMKTEATAEMIREAAPDTVILATGATPFTPDLEELDEERTVQAWDVVAGTAVLGRSVAIADWRCDWVGLGVAEILAKQGHQVTLCVNGTMPGQTIQQYVRDVWLGTMHKLGVRVIPMMRLAGIVDDTVYFQHTMSGEPEIVEGIDTVVLAMGGKSVDALESELQGGYDGDLSLIGDCASPRTAEEAVFEGLKAGVAV